MNKDVIYIDTEDDITAIIAKVKAAGSKIVALVPPKRVGVLQSVVNLKLLNKAATNAEKRIVLITSDQSLTSLAASLEVPVAKNLQSRPEVPMVSAPKTDAEEVIEGADLPVGDLDKALGSQQADKSIAEEMSEDLEIADAPKAADIARETLKKSTRGSEAPSSPRSYAAAAGGSQKNKGKFKVPNFSKFRKQIFIFGGLGIIAIVALVWALVYAPHASIKIEAETSSLSIDKSLTLDPEAASSDTAKLALKPEVQQLVKSTATTFTATGTKDIGDKASGSIAITNCDSSGSFTIPAGTTFTSSSGYKFTSNAAVTVPGYSSSTASACNNNPTQNAGKANVAVTASEIGDEYNISATSFTVNLSVVVTATSSSAMSGGSHKTATVVSQNDVDTAEEKLTAPDETEAKAELKEQFSSDYIIIEESFTAVEGDPAVSPAVGEAATEGKITVETTYTYVAISKTDSKAILTDAVNAKLAETSDQQMYSLGEDDISFQNFKALSDGTYETRMLTTAYIGPKIDTESLKEQLVGKRYGEIQSIITQIQGVKNVEVNFSPFWVNTAPSADKIDISFTVNNEE